MGPFLGDRRSSQHRINSLAGSTIDAQSSVTNAVASRSSPYKVAGQDGYTTALGAGRMVI